METTTLTPSPIRRYWRDAPLAVVASVPTAAAMVRPLVSSMGFVLLVSWSLVLLAALGVVPQGHSEQESKQAATGVRLLSLQLGFGVRLISRCLWRLTKTAFWFWLVWLEVRALRALARGARR